MLFCISQRIRFKCKHLIYMIIMNTKKVTNYIKIMLLTIVVSAAILPANAQQEKQPADLVYPLLDAANSRWFYFSSATRPFGMVNLSPDMGVGGAWDSGYRYNRDTIIFFSHIHAWQLSGIPVLPVTGDFKGHLGAEKGGLSFRRT